MTGLRRFSTMLVLGTTGLVAIASTGTRVQPSRFFATPIEPQRHHHTQRHTLECGQQRHLEAEAGRYGLYCSLPEHLQHGMHTTLVAR